MKRIISLVLACITFAILLCSCKNDSYGGDFDWESYYATLATQSKKESFDFQGNGLIVQTEQYGKCRIDVTGVEPAVTVVISGKNLCGGAPGTALPREYNGIAYTKENDGAIIATGTAQANSVCYVAGRWGGTTTDADRIFLPEGTYTLSGCPTGGGASTYRLRLAVVDGEGEVTYYDDIGEGVSFTLREGAYVGTCIQILSGTTVAGLKFSPQIEIGGQSTQYEGYRGEAHTVKIKNGVGTLEVSLSTDAADTKAYTFVSTGESLTVNGFGTIKNCVQPMWRATKPHFTIIDDDGKDDVYSVLMPLLNGRGIKFSTSVIPSRLNVQGYLTTEELRKIVEAGNKVMCHGKSHKNLKNTATTYAERYEEIVGGKQMLKDLGFDVDCMVYPNGSYDDEVIAITKSAYKYGISTSGETTYGQQRYNEDPINLYAIERINIGSYYSGQNAEEKAQALADAKKNIDVCIEKNYLCVIMTHIGDAGDEGIAQIIELIDYIESKGYRIDDFDTAIQAHIQLP